MVIGLFLMAFSKEKIEDELISEHILMHKKKRMYFKFR